MNYLAHAFLSFHKPEVMVGNMISDFVKGKLQYTYPPPIQVGIQLHRYIDAFTDAHIITKEAATYFKPAVGLYAGAFVDIVYDHFLAIDAQQFHPLTLQQFSLNTYQTLEANKIHLPITFVKMLPYMVQHNWLYNYQYKWGIEKSFNGMVKRAKYLSSANAAFEIFNSNYLALQLLYQSFIKEVKVAAENKLSSL